MNRLIVNHRNRHRRFIGGVASTPPQARNGFAAG
jgi:hypothetical protein